MKSSVDEDSPSDDPLLLEFFANLAADCLHESSHLSSWTIAVKEYGRIPTESRLHQAGKHVLYFDVVKGDCDLSVFETSEDEQRALLKLCVEGAQSMDALSALLNIYFLDFKPHNLASYEGKVVAIDLDVMTGNELQINCVNSMKTIGFVPPEHLLAPSFSLLVHDGTSYQTAILLLGSLMGSRTWKHPFKCIEEEIFTDDEEDEETDRKGHFKSFIEDMVKVNFNRATHDHVRRALERSENEERDERKLAMDLLCWLVLAGDQYDQGNHVIKYIKDNWQNDLPIYVEGDDFETKVACYSLKSQLNISADVREGIFADPLFGNSSFVELVRLALHPNPAIRPPVQDLIDAIDAALGEQ